MMPKSVDDFCDMAAERAVLAGPCRYGGDSYIDIADIIDANTFGDILNQSIFKSIESFYEDGNFEKKLDIPSIISASRTVGVEYLINTPDSMRHLRSIFNCPIERDTVRREALKLFKLSLTKQLDEVTAQMRRDFRTVEGNESLDEILSLAEKPLFDFIGALNSTEGDGPTHIATGVDEFIQNLIDNPRDNIGISSGFALYDYYIGGGFRRATVSVVGARTKIGKTVLCDNIALHVAGNLGIPVLNLDTEMTREEHLARILSHLCMVRSNTIVTIREIETGKFGTDAQKVAAMRDAAQWLKTIPYEYNTVINTSFEELVASIRRWVRQRVKCDKTGRTNDCLVIYDYLQSPEYGEYAESIKEYQILGYQMLSLLRTASKCDIPVFTLVQLNRDGIEKESTAVVADSDRVLRKGANFAILKPKSENELVEDGPENGTHKLKLIITRHGEAMAFGDYINLVFDGKTARFTEAGTKNELEKRKKSRGPKGFPLS